MLFRSEMVTELPRYESGFLTPPSGPGLGTALQPGINSRKDAMVRWSRVGK